MRLTVHGALTKFEHELIRTLTGEAHARAKLSTERRPKVEDGSSKALMNARRMSVADYHTNAVAKSGLNAYFNGA